MTFLYDVKSVYVHEFDRGVVSDQDGTMNDDVSPIPGPINGVVRRGAKTKKENRRTRPHPAVMNGNPSAGDAMPQAVYPKPEW
ncbi:hypothetical protein MGYG_07398 [Nannizzia gypsea CBS 118893]|uniref:Uncharacterized protein n=1 Tax=Arthroderma gypseum (strain ATCC MYA-4604 / CBS 118893) TaxID=535722 RepID=E4V318_ARTGP|nr:hypothetical protein MGYG_07398 [Nannizzia gypsea CBS 118893]EFR04392.1 hypothetical protein MGYG_07398 [Nannizzia gypsea CBS 118893]